LEACSSAFFLEVALPFAICSPSILTLTLIRFITTNVDQANVGDNIHGNIFEALVGAIYLDKGYSFSQKFIFENVIIPYVDIEKLEGKITSYKGLIIEWCQKQKKKNAFDP